MASAVLVYQLDISMGWNIFVSLFVKFIFISRKQSGMLKIQQKAHK